MRVDTQTGMGKDAVGKVPSIEDYLAKQQAAQTQSDAAGNCLENSRLPLSVMLRREMGNTRRKQDRTARMLTILEAHPEFEEFLELQELLQQRHLY